MKNRLFLVLPLAATLMVPAMAQQSTQMSGQQDSTAAGSSDQTSMTQQAPNQPVDDLGPHQPLQPETRQGFWGKMNPFARKKYVQNQVAPIRNRVNELDELTAKNTAMVKDVDARATRGIQQATAMANTADQHAVDAGNRAQQANTTAQQASNRLQTVEQVVGNLDQYQAANQLELRFRPGQVGLSKRDKEAVDEIAAELKAQKGYIVEVQAFSPGRGEAAVQNSKKMADSVVRYLVLNHEIPVYRIYELGMGNARVQAGSSKTQGNVSRVEVTVLKNGVDQLADATPTTSRGYSSGAQGGGIGAATSTSAQQPTVTVTTVPGNVSAPASR